MSKAGATLSPIFSVSRPRSASGREASSRLDLTARASGVGAGNESGAGSVRVFAQWLISRISSVLVSSSEPKLLWSPLQQTEQLVRVLRVRMPTSIILCVLAKRGRGGGGEGRKSGGREGRKETQHQTAHSHLQPAQCHRCVLKLSVDPLTYLTDASGTAESHSRSPHV